MTQRGACCIAYQLVPVSGATANLFPSMNHARIVLLHGGAKRETLQNKKPPTTSSSNMADYFLSIRHQMCTTLREIKTCVFKSRHSKKIFDFPPRGGTPQHSTCVTTTLREIKKCEFKSRHSSKKIFRLITDH